MSERYNARLKIEYVPIDSIRPYERNPRKNEQAVPPLKESIKNFKFSQPITVDGEGVVIIGHTRLLAAKALEMKEVPIIRRTDLTKAQVKALRLADNKIQEKSGWDFDFLDQELKELEESFDTDMADFGFGDDASDSDPDDFFEDADGDREKKPKTITVTCPHCGEEFETEV